MKKEEDYREKVIKLLDDAQDAIIILTTDGESSDFLTKGDIDNMGHIITLALMGNETRFIAFLSAIVGVVGAQMNAGEHENAQATLKALKAAVEYAENQLSIKLN